MSKTKDASHYFITWVKSVHWGHCFCKILYRTRMCLTRSASNVTIVYPKSKIILRAFASPIFWRQRGAPNSHFGSLMEHYRWQRKKKSDPMFLQLWRINLSLLIRRHCLHCLSQNKAGEIETKLRLLSSLTRGRPIPFLAKNTASIP